MSRFFESIKLQDGKLCLLHLHQQRMNDTRLLHFNIKTPIDLEKKLIVPDEYKNGLYKCRVSYDTVISEIKITPYEISKHKKVKIIESPNAFYASKSEDRKLFSEAMKNNQGIDDCLFSVNGKLTDATYANIILFDGEHWVTPINYLLKGVKRTFLLEKQQIFEKEILVKKIQDYSKIGFINALRDFEMVYDFVIKKDVLWLGKAFRACS